MYVCMHVSMHVCMYVCLSAYVDACASACVRTCVDSYNPLLIYIHIHRKRCLCSDVCIWGMSVYAHTYIYACA